MNKLKKWIKSEMDVEFFACVHSMSMILVFGFELYLCGIKSLSYGIILEMMIMGYVISWFQKALFLKEKVYSGNEYLIKSILWSVVPVIITMITAYIFKWYKELPTWIGITFIAIMMIYYVMVWFFLQVFYIDETNQLNQMLSEYKGNHKKGVNNHEHNRD